MIRTSRKLFKPFCLVSVLLLTAACNSNVSGEQRSAPVTAANNHLKTAIDAAFPGFRPWKSYQNATPHNRGSSPNQASGDFNGDGLADEALILTNAKEWKLAVFLLKQTGDYSVKEITTFPGKDKDWKTTPVEKIHLYPVAATEQSADKLGLDVTGMAASLEYSWREKNDSFAASRIHKTVAVENKPGMESADKGVATLYAMELRGEEKTASYLDIDQQLTGVKTGADLQFTAGRGTMTFYALDPVGGATAMPFGKSVPGYDDCRAQQKEMSDGNMPELEVGMQFCVKTDQENLARVWIQGIDLNADSIALGYQIWISDY